MRFRLLMQTHLCDLIYFSILNVVEGFQEVSTSHYSHLRVESILLHGLKE